MKEQLLLAWHINNDNNLLLLKNIGEEQLAISLSPRSRNVCEQLAHLHNVRITWTKVIAKSVYLKSLLLSKETTLTISVLANMFNFSA